MIPKLVYILFITYHGADFRVAHAFTSPASCHVARRVLQMDLARAGLNSSGYCLPVNADQFKQSESHYDPTTIP